MKGRRFHAPSALLLAFSAAAVGAGVARVLTTTYLPVLLERIDDAPFVIGLVMVVNAVAGFVVPLVVGPWSDRRESDGLGRRVPFMIGGTVVGAGGLVAVGVGNSSSYFALALAAAVVYTGLNALTTTHRALLAEDVPDARRPAANSAQELAAVGGGAVAVAIGGALLTPAPAAAFVIGAALLVASLVPTVVVGRRMERTVAPPPAPSLRVRAPRRVARCAGRARARC